MNKNVWTPVAMVAVAVGIAAALLFASNGSVNDDDDTASGSTAESTDRLVRPDSHRLTDPEGSTVTFVEFLDFECEGCRAAFPVIEEMRGIYGDRVTFVVRYFPLSGHFNAERAARAVEAAAQQDKFEEMYQLMFTTQAEWGEQQRPLDGLFRTYAEQLELDLEAFDEAYADLATLERILRDRADGEALGVEATPTFFLNGELFEPQSYEELTAAFDEALGE